MADQFLGEVRCVGFNFPPAGWAFCDGQLMSIAQNTALFSLLGTFYGGDGKSTFALPNLQGNVAIAQGQGGGLSPRFIGEASGAANVILSQSQMPTHNHGYMTDPDDGPGNIPTPGPTSSYSSGPAIYTTATSPLVPMAASALALTGQGLAHNNMMPFLVLNFVIALQGIFPSRA